MIGNFDCIQITCFKQTTEGRPSRVKVLYVTGLTETIDIECGLVSKLDKAKSARLYKALDAILVDK